VHVREEVRVGEGGVAGPDPQVAVALQTGYDGTIALGFTVSWAGMLVQRPAEL
jgi:hypothetical protein